MHPGSGCGELAAWFSVDDFGYAFHPFSPSCGGGKTNFRNPTFFSYTENSREISVIAEASVMKDFPDPALFPWLSVSDDLFRALQIDSDFGLESSGKRINDLSAPLAQAGISIFYLSTYLTDFIFVKEKRLPLVISTLRSRNFTFIDDSEPHPPHFTPPTPSPLGADTTWLSFRTDPTDGQHGRDMAQACDQDALSTSSSSTSSKRPDSFRAPPPELLADARMLDKRLLETPPLRLVGLDREYLGSWGMQIVRVLFYPEVGGVRGGEGMEEGGSRNRFFSYTVTEEGISLVADANVLRGLPDHHLFTSSELTNLRCIQVDLKEYGLDRYGIVWSMSQPLVAGGINLLYLSTASAANVLRLIFFIFLE
ncbi:Cytosolic arginine sensor for mTORC1 subunit 2 [Dinochytrium kinnereticum]|nr:Cytosolic arginine sensor for mTORC1 subunit 2 [Dinochytrium kinnereticum]